MWCVHFKDVNGAALQEARRQLLDFHAAVRYGVFAPLGKGIMNLSGLIDLLQRRGFNGWVVVEADVLPGGAGADSPLANAILGREFLRGFGI